LQLLLATPTSLTHDAVGKVSRLGHGKSWVTVTTVLQHVHYSTSYKTKHALRHTCCQKQSTKTLVNMLSLSLQYNMQTVTAAATLLCTKPKSCY